MDTKNNDNRISFQKKCIRLFAYCIAFFIVLHRKFTILMKKRFAMGICVLLLGCALLISLMGQEKGSVRANTQEAVITYHNQVDNYGEGANIDLGKAYIATNNKESVSAKEKADPVQINTSDEIQMAKEKKDQVATDVVKESQKDNSVMETENIRSSDVNEVGDSTGQTKKSPLAWIRGLIESRGTQPEEQNNSMKYQYPVELGQKFDRNYDGILQDGEYIYKEKLETQVVTSTEQRTDTQEYTEKTVTEEKEAVSSEKTEDSSENQVTESIQVQDAEIQTAESTESQDVEKVTEANNSVVMDVSEEVKESLFENTDEEGSQNSEDIVSDESETTTEYSDQEKEETENSKKHKTTKKEEDDPVYADESYFQVSGSLSVKKNVFVGDITITPTGKNGYDRVRIGDEGAFRSQEIITQDAIDGMVYLYFSDGEHVTEAVPYTYSKDSVGPAFSLDEDVTRLCDEEQKQYIYFTNKRALPIHIDDQTETSSGTGVEEVTCKYADQDIRLQKDMSIDSLVMPDAFFGNVVLNASDGVGNEADSFAEYLLVEQDAPRITFASDQLRTAPYTLWVDVEEEGHIVSGIQGINCTINGQNYEIENMEVLQNTTLTKDIQVPSKCEFSIPFKEAGTYQIVVGAIDYAGNIHEYEETIQIVKPELVSVAMPSQSVLHIDPFRVEGNEQIYSENITLDNQGDVDMRVTVKNILVTISEDASDKDKKKECQLYMVAPDTGEKILLKRGNNKDVYTYRLPQNAEGDLENICFVGNLPDGSEAIWEDGDIQIQIQLAFEKWSEN